MDTLLSGENPLKEKAVSDQICGFRNVDGGLQGSPVGSREAGGGIWNEQVPGDEQQQPGGWRASWVLDPGMEQVYHQPKLASTGLAREGISPPPNKTSRCEAASGLAKRAAEESRMECRG